MNEAADTDVASLSLRLKEATTELHRAAERSPFQQALVRGQVSEADYALWLRQMEEIHRVLEDGLPRLVEARPETSGLQSTWFSKLPHLSEDLDRFDPERSSALLASTLKYAARIREMTERMPLALLGVDYVLEGSMNGGRFIARSILKRFTIEPDEPGTRYLDPYGDSQQDTWMQFKNILDGVVLSEQEQVDVVEAACECFDSIREVSDELAAEAHSEN